MTNFEYLYEKKEYELFSAAAAEAEKVYASSPAMCAVGCRKALELAVKWVYSADDEIKMPYRENLQSLIHEHSFRFAVDQDTWSKLPYIVNLGNLAVHTGKNIKKSDALASLKGLFEFIQWIDYCYGRDYEERSFKEEKIPVQQVILDVKKIREQESLIEEKDAEIEALRRRIAAMSAAYTAEKGQHQQQREFNAEDPSEYETRKRYIDLGLKLIGWEFDGENADVREEYPIDDMNGVPGKKGAADYVLFGKDGLPLAVIEAKRTSKDPNDGKRQAFLYADALERKFGRRPMMFTSNGFEHYFWDDQTGPQRKVSGFFSKGDLQKLMNRRAERRTLSEIPISDRITDRYYQKEAIRAVCDHVEQGIRKNLLVMATGTGKTRTASSLTDVLSRGRHITNVLFLADRTALVKQAKYDFKNHLPDMSLCNLCESKDDRNARIVFSTYPTMLNAIDNIRTKDGFPLYSPAHFDLIIIDESHRSIFKKYKVIFEYFDAVLVGLTATPKMDVDRNTYDFFEMENGVPTYVYDYDTAVEKDHVLVPYFTYEVKTKFEADGILYRDLSEEDKRRYEDDFAEDGTMPEEIPSHALNKFIFNEKTVDTVLQDLMERGIKVAGGDRIGKTIIFAQNKTHAQFIVERFDKLYPQYRGLWAQRVVYTDSYAQSIIDDFKNPQKEPHIAVSVDMLDTGIDVPECVNLVFFKKVRSKTKFWQMIGRGTRLAPELMCMDSLDGEYQGKRRFLIFDYCRNFEFFEEKPNGIESRETKTLTENIFMKRIRLIKALQEAAFADEVYQNYRKSLIAVCADQIHNLNTSLISVRLNLRYVEKFKTEGAFDFIGDGDEKELERYIAPLVYMEEKDEAAKRFDNFMYRLILEDIESAPSFENTKNSLCYTAELLGQRANIPQVKEKIKIIRQILSEEFWESEDILRYESVRSDLRGLMRFLEEERSGHRPVIYTKLDDPVIEAREGAQLPSAYDFENYRRKVSRYVEENGNTLAIYKLKHNIALSPGDFNELERILTSELGTREDYVREYGDTPFGLMIRRIAKLDHDAAMQAFSQFINDESLNQKQIAFVHKIINHIEQNGYMENVSDLQKPPFDKPVGFIKMFDPKTRVALVQTIQKITENAVNIEEMKG